MTNIIRRAAFTVAAVLGTATVFGATEAAAEWPTDDIRIIVPYAPGGTSDNIARAITPTLEDILGVQVTVENIGGAGGTIGMARLARSSADGTVFGSTPNATLTIAPNMRQAAYDLDEDIVAVAKLADVIGGLAVRNDFPADDMEGLVAYMKEHPGEVTFGSPGMGSTIHLLIELFEKATGTEASHVPFKGSGESINNLMGGHIDAVFDYNPVLAQMQSGSVKSIAILNRERWEGLPDIPVLNEVGYPEIKPIMWYGVVAPSGVPEEAVQGMQAAIEEALQSPDVIERFKTLGLVPDYADSESYDQMLKDDDQFFAGILKEMNLSKN